MCASASTRQLFSGKLSQDGIRAWLDSLTPEQRRLMNERADEYDREQHRDRVRQRIARAGIPRSFFGAQIANVPELQGADLDRNMLMLGAAGRGKTYAACAVAISRAQECTVRFATMADILLDIQGTFGGKASITDVADKYRNTALLVIDDFGKEKPTDYSIGQFFALLNSRINSGKQTIVTTNYTGRDLFERLSQCGEAETALAVVSRLGCSPDRETGFQQIRFNGKDRRVKHG